MTTLVARLWLLGVLLAPTGALAQIIPENFELLLTTEAHGEQDVGGLSCPAPCIFPQSFVGTQQSGEEGEFTTLHVLSGASSSSISLSGSCDATAGGTAGSARLEVDFVSDGSPLLASWRWEIIQGQPLDLFSFVYRVAPPALDIAVSSAAGDDLIAGSTVLNLSPGSHRFDGLANCGITSFGGGSRSVTFEVRLEPLLPPSEPVPFLSTRGLLLLGLALLAITLFAGARNAGLSDRS